VTDEGRLKWNEARLSQKLRHLQYAGYNRNFYVLVTEHALMSAITNTERQRQPICFIEKLLSPICDRVRGTTHV